jgi:hypothetical protein
MKCSHESLESWDTRVSHEIGNSEQGQKPLNMETEESTALEAITRQPMMTQQTEKN